MPISKSGKWIFLFVVWSFGAHSQAKLDKNDLIWGKDQEFDLNDFPDASIVRTSDDFFLAKGKLGKSNPPNSTASFVFEDKEIKNSGEFNNDTVAILESVEPKKVQLAKVRWIAGVKFDPTFFPFRYNLGRIYEIEKNYEKALIEFEHAKNEVPQYYRTYIHIGELSLILREPHYAVAQWKEAARLNPMDTTAFLLLAEYYLETGLNNRCKQYINLALKIDEESPNAKLALARLAFQSGNEFGAYKIFKRTRLESPEGKPKQYEKKFHYFYAETSSKLGDYEKAEEQYSILLKYPNDPFFSNFPIKVIERRRDIAKKFADVKRLQREDDESL